MSEYFTKDGDKFKEVEGSLLSQAEVDSVIEKRLERERGKFADYDTLKERASKVDTIKSEFETKLGEKDVTIGELTGKVKTAELATDKVKIVNEFKLSDELSEFVTGDTIDEMRQRAEKLSKGFKGGKVVIKKDGKPADNQGDQSSSKSIASNLFGKKSQD